MILHEQLLERVRHHIDAIYHDNPLDADLEGLARGAARADAARWHVDEVQARAAASITGTSRDAIVITYGDSLLRSRARNPWPPQAVPRRYAGDAVERRAHSARFTPGVPTMASRSSTIPASTRRWATGSDIRADRRRLRPDGRPGDQSLLQPQPWFENFLKGRDPPGRAISIRSSPTQDLTAVVRPRTITAAAGRWTDVDGTRHVWCTFSHDQVDLDFRNPEVLKQFVSIVRQYLDNGVRIFRLDAVAFLWKTPGTSCLNLEETHEVVRLLRTLVEHARPDAMLITETNIPNRENLSYFGNANEAHCVYNFSLPPLLVQYPGDRGLQLPETVDDEYATGRGTARLTFNFIASHDGIGLRPTEGLLSEGEVEALIETMQGFGGHVSWRALDCGRKASPTRSTSPCSTLCREPCVGTGRAGAMQRFLCAHAIMLGLEGIPGIYIHSLLGTRNDYQRVETHGPQPRHQPSPVALPDALEDGAGESREVSPCHSIVFAAPQASCSCIRRGASGLSPQCHAVHPAPRQSGLFAFWRQSMDPLPEHLLYQQYHRPGATPGAG